MPGSKPPAIAMCPARNYPKELEHLYERFSSVNRVIEVVEEYRRVLKKPTTCPGQRKTA